MTVKCPHCGQYVFMASIGQVVMCHCGCEFQKDLEDMEEEFSSKDVGPYPDETSDNLEERDI